MTSNKTINTLDDLFQAWSKDAFCTCELRTSKDKVIDQDDCNCCEYCQKQCGHTKQTEQHKMKAKDFNMYKDWHSDNVILEVIGLDGEIIEKLMFASYSSARLHILKNY